MRTETRATTWRTTVVGLVMSGVVACTEHSTGSIALELSTAPHAGAPAGDTVAFGADTLFIGQAALVVREMEIAPADAGDCEGTPDEHEEECPVLTTGPTLLRLPVGQARGAGLTVRVPPDQYSLLQFQIQTLDTARDRAFLAEHPEFGQGSVHLQGVYSRSGVRDTVDYWVRFNEREELALEPPFDVTRDSTARLVLRANVAEWFLNADRNGLVDPGTIGPGQPNEGLVRDNIRTSLKAIAASRTASP
jgi:hypothetical protein